MSAAVEIVVNARWQLRREALAEALSLLPEVRRASLQEPGCLAYEVFQSIDEPHRLLLVERYRDTAAVEAHRATPHFRELVLGRLVPMLESRTIELLRATDAA